MTTSTIRVAGALVALPDPERIPVKRTRAALEHCIELRAKLSEAGRARDAADARARDAANAERMRLGDLYDADPDHHDENLGEAVEDAQRDAKRAQLHLSGLVRAEEKALAALRAALTAEADAWAVVARADAKKALTKLATAVRMAEGARDDLAATLGVLRTVATPGQLTPELVADGYTFPIDDGVTGLREALARATHELAGRS